MARLEPEYAGFWRRVAATLIDSFLFLVLAAILRFLIAGDSGVQMVVSDQGVQMHSQNGWLENLLMAVITVVLWVKLTGTPGKLLMGCHVVDAGSLQPLTYKQAVIRYLAYFVSLIPLGLGFLWVGWDKRKQGFHDKIAKTVVLGEPVTETSDESSKSLEQILREVK